MSSESITTFKNLYEETKEFNNKQDFLNYYETHKKEIDEMKTRGLNVKFRINGYHIGRKEGRLILYPEQREKNNDSLVRAPYYNEQVFPLNLIPIGNKRNE